MKKTRSSVRKRAQHGRPSKRASRPPARTLGRPRRSASASRLGELDYAETSLIRLGRGIRGASVPVRDVCRHLRRAFTISRAAGYRFTRALLETAPTNGQLFAEAEELFKESTRLPSLRRRDVIRGILDAGGPAGRLFLVQRISGLKRKLGREYMGDFLKTGGRVLDVARWLRFAGGVLRKHVSKHPSTAGAFVEAAEETVRGEVEDRVDALLEGIDSVLDAATDAGVAIVDLFAETASWTADQFGDLLAALNEAGVELGEFIGAVFQWSFREVARFIDAAFAVGFTVADLLEHVVSEGYFVLRRFIRGILANGGPVGEVLDFVLLRAEGATSELWRRTIRALRFARVGALAVVRWMVTQTRTAVTAVISAWEAVGASLRVLYNAALTAGGIAWEMIGEATATLGNSIYYAYKFLTTSGVQFVFEFTSGLLKGGHAVASILDWAFEQGVEVCAEVVRAAVEIGVTIATMLRVVARNPRSALPTFLRAMASIGQTLQDLLRATIVETAPEFRRVVVAALREIGHSVKDICEAALKLGAAALATAVADLFNGLGSYRPLSAAERADARTVFGDSLDYDLVFLSTEDPLNEVIFGVQDFFSGHPNSRAFVTMNLINFDVDDGQIDRPTLIHELTHVWQAREFGGIYMAKAIEAQSVDGYNYGYRKHNSESLNHDLASPNTYTATLSGLITPSTLHLIRDDATGSGVLARDDGAGNFVFEDGTSSTGMIDYTTGSVVIGLAATPPSGVTFSVDRRVTLNMRSGGGDEEGYESFLLGVDGEAALNDANGDFERFNREQQGQILMHPQSQESCRLGR